METVLQQVRQQMSYRFGADALIQIIKRWAQAQGIDVENSVISVVPNEDAQTSNGRVTVVIEEHVPDVWINETGALIVAPSVKDD